MDIKKVIIKINKKLTVSFLNKSFLLRSCRNIVKLIVKKDKITKKVYIFLISITEENQMIFNINKRFSDEISKVEYLVLPLFKLTRIDLFGKIKSETKRTKINILNISIISLQPNNNC